ncbi:MAG: hypothetical protein R2941_03500 [Desulfobacterales bacterium]
MESAGTFFRKMFDIREGEELRVFLMFSFVFLLISSLMIAKPVCNALFLYRFGAARLPYVFILVAFCAAGMSKFYSVQLRRFDLCHLIIRTLWLAVLSLILFWALLCTDAAGGAVLFIFYVWTAIFALVSSSQFWILANSIFNPREARRLFGFIGTGAIAGGIFGGYLTRFTAQYLGSLHLLWICAGFLYICIPIVRTIQTASRRDKVLQKFRQEKQLRETADNPFHIIRNSRHLLLTAGILGFGVIAGRMVEYQFSAIAAAQIQDSDRLAAFFGFWLSNLNAASLFIQVIATRKVVTGLGVGASLFFLPLAILSGALLVLIHPVLWTAIFIKLCDGSLKNSLNKSGIELLILPVPSDIKKQAKSFIDVFADSFATGLGGILLLLLTESLEFPVRQVSLLMIVLIGIWLYMVILVRREYIRSFRRKLAGNSPLTEKHPDFRNPCIIGECCEILEKGDASGTVNTLIMIREIRDQRFIPCYRNLLRHPDSCVRREVLRNICFCKHPDFTQEALALVHDPDQKVKTEALHYLFRHPGEKEKSLIREYLRHEDYRIRGAALLALAWETRGNQKLKTMFDLCGILRENLSAAYQIQDQEQARFVRMNCARVIGAANLPDFHPHLHIFLNDPDTDVVKAAIRGAGETRRKDFISVLMPFLAKEEFRKAAAHALKDLGPDIGDTLAQWLNNPLADHTVRIQIPDILAQMGKQKAADVLSLNIRHPDPAIRCEVVRAMNHIRVHFPFLKFDDRRIVRTILEETREHLDLLTVLCSQFQNSGNGAGTANNPSPANAAGFPSPGTGTAQEDRQDVREAREQLIHSLEKRLDDNLERIFGLLGLKYPPQEISDVYRNLQSERADLRSSAVEFLDNLLETNLRRVIIPIVESAPAGPGHIPDLRGMKMLSEYESLRLLLSGGDSRMHMRVLRLIACLKSKRYNPLAGEMLAASDPQVREMAGSVLKEAGML